MFFEMKALLDMPSRLFNIRLMTPKSAAGLSHSSTVYSIIVLQLSKRNLNTIKNIPNVGQNVKLATWRCLSQTWWANFGISRKTESAHSWLRQLEQSTPSQHQAGFHPLPHFIAPHRPAAHFHTANDLFGAIIRPRHIRLPIKHPVFGPVFAQTDQ